MVIQTCIHNIHTHLVCNHIACGLRYVQMVGGYCHPAYRVTCRRQDEDETLSGSKLQRNTSFSFVYHHKASHMSIHNMLYEADIA